MNESNNNNLNFAARLRNIRNRLTNLFKNNYTLRNKSKHNELISKIKQLDKKYDSMSDERFDVFAKSKTYEFRTKLASGTKIEDIMVDALAIASQAIKRSFGYAEVYETQLEAALAMIGETYEVKDGIERKTVHQRVIAEMKTGEGKTLVQILTGYLNVLEATCDKSNKKSVHVLTANDALARRDAYDNQKVYHLLGLTCGFVPSSRYQKLRNISTREFNDYKRKQYNCDIVYSTAEAVAFDYLDDNLATDKKNRFMQKPFGYVIVDEADDILIDKATSDLILVQSTKNELELKQEKKTRELYAWATKFLNERLLTSIEFDQYDQTKDVVFYEDYAYVKDRHGVYLSDKVYKMLEEGIDPNDVTTYTDRLLALESCIIAKHSMLKGREYVVEIDENKKAGKMVIIDSNTGRKKDNSVYEGMMQLAIESKEDYEMQKKGYHMEYSKTNTIRGMISYPDFIGLYQNGVCGMTGTSDPEEFRDLYGFETYNVETHKPNIRKDEKAVRLYATKEYKNKAILEEVKRAKRTGQPVLIGTSSVTESQEIYNILQKNNILCNLLNAENDFEENEIIKKAGILGAVTVATNMAGRGTDIKLGGEDKKQGEIIKSRGGLLVISTTFNKSERIDRQLKGRAGRQGDPGSTIQFCSLEDDLVKEYYKDNGSKNPLTIIKENYAHGDGRVNNTILQNLVKKCQDRRASEDKAVRSYNQKFSSVLAHHRDQVYNAREEILNATPEQVDKVTDVVIDRYSGILSNLSKEEVTSLAGHIVDVDKCYSENKALFASNIKSEIYEKLTQDLLGELRKIHLKVIREYMSSHYKLRDLSKDEFLKLFVQVQKFQDVINDVVAKQKEYVENHNKQLKEKYLKIIDTYWVSHINELEDIKLRVGIVPTNDPIKQFEHDSNNALFNMMYPAMYNEMITYATDSKREFGDYEIQYSNDFFAAQKALV